MSIPLANNDNHCDKCGAFIGKCGCTNPECRRSEKTQSLIDKETPEKITEAECDDALKEGFYIRDKEGNKVGFGEPLLIHLDKDKNEEDRRDRKEHLLFGMDAVRHYDSRKVHEIDGEKRPTYFKRLEGKKKGIVVVAGPENSDDEGLIHYVFTIHKRKKDPNMKRTVARLIATAAIPSALSSQTDGRRLAEFNHAKVRGIARTHGSEGRTTLPFRCKNYTTSAPNAQGGGKEIT